MALVSESFSTATIRMASVSIWDILKSTMKDIAKKPSPLRPKFAMWCKWHWSLLRWIPGVGPWLWTWGDKRVDRWHEERRKELCG
jgi:hypothetical protein